MADIHLTPNDDVIDVLKSLREQEADGIRVFIPSGSPLLDKQINLKLIAREAENMGKKIAFESEDAEVRKQLGVSRSETNEKFGFVDGDIAARDPSVAPVRAESSAGANIFSSLKQFFSSIKTPFGKFPAGKKWVLPASLTAGLFLIGALLFLFLFLVPKATITLVVDSDQLVKTVDIIASSSAETVLLEQKVVPARKVSVQKQGTRTAPATGESTVGEKAEGTVTIYNQTDEEKSLQRGTLLNANNLQFVLDSGVSIEAQTMSSTQSAEGERTVTYTAGKTNVNITAADVGDKYNLPSDTEFTVANFAEESVYAKNTQALSGGFSEEVVVVSEQDVQTITDSLTRELEQSAYSELDLELPDSYTIPQGVISSEVLSKQLSTDVGEEADEVRLQMNVQSSAIAYSEDEYRQVLENYLESKIPENYRLREDSVQFSTLDAKRQEDDLIITAKVKGNLVPAVDLEEIRQYLAGAKLASARSYLTDLPNVTQVNIRVSKFLSSFYNHLPKRAENIVIEFGQE